MVSANIERCKKKIKKKGSRTNLTHQPFFFLAQVTNTLFSFGEPDDNVPGIPGILNVFPTEVERASGSRNEG